MLRDADSLAIRLGAAAHAPLCAEEKDFPGAGEPHRGHGKMEITGAFPAACPAQIPRTKILASSRGNVRNMLHRWPLPLRAKTKSHQQSGVFLTESAEQFEQSAAANDVQERRPVERNRRIQVIGHAVVAAHWRADVVFSITCRVVATSIRHGRYRHAP